MQLLFSNVDYNDYLGRIGIGRIERGSVRRGGEAVLCRADGTTESVRIARLYLFEGLRRAEVEQAAFGDIVAVAGIAA
jgi:GTP-binding protein